MCGIVAPVCKNTTAGSFLSVRSDDELLLSLGFRTASINELSGSHKNLN